MNQEPRTMNQKLRTKDQGLGTRDKGLRTFAAYCLFSHSYSAAYRSRLRRCIISRARRRAWNV